LSQCKDSVDKENAEVGRGRESKDHLAAEIRNEKILAVKKNSNVFTERKT